MIVNKKKKRTPNYLFWERFGETSEHKNKI